MIAWRHDHHLAPPVREIVFAARRDGGVLQLPEFGGIGKTPVLAEQIGDHRQPRSVGIEQGIIGLDRLPAEQPRLEIGTARREGLRIVE